MKAVTTFVNQVVNTVIAVVEVAIIATVVVTFGTACTYTNFAKTWRLMPYAGPVRAGTDGFELQ